MATTADELAARYPVMAYNFVVVIGGAQLSFSEVTGLVREYERVTYRHGLSFRESITTYYLDKYAPVTLKRGVTRGVTSLRAWLASQEERAVTITLRDGAGAPVLTWRVAKAVPVKLEAPTFRADGTEVAIESLELMAAGVTVTEHG